MGSQWASSAISVEQVQHLVVKSGSRLNHGMHPVLSALFEKHHTHVCQRIGYYRFLYYLVAETRPAVAVELGVEFGLASAYMVAAAHTYGGHVIGVDKNELLVEDQAIHKAWPGSYIFIHGDSVAAADLVAALTEQHGPIGVLYQDSSHHYAPSCREWDLYRPLMAENGIWVCDDITPSFYQEGVDEKSMVAYFDERPGREKLKFPNVLHYGNTIGVILL